MKTQLLIGTLLTGLLTAAHSLAAPVNINQADAATLAESLTGVGPVTSQAIIAYREENGAFEKAEDLMKVNGIGEKTFENIKADVLLED
ncbi:MAG TPA: helix-hairpin-helix domain-containing protein [Arenicellales bacterium]|nr:helix-hairpin-helix domain-containing protein [Arenicellales bacterium]